MHRTRTALLLAPPLVAACAGNPDRHTLAELHHAAPDLAEAKVEDSLDRAMQGYEKYLAEAPESALTPEAMRRLADLKLEKEYGILGGGESRELPAPKAAPAADGAAGSTPPAAPAAPKESEQEFERRAARATALAPSDGGAPLALPGGGEAAPEGPLAAIALYDQILASYPDYAHNDQVLYQKARAYDELGRVDEAIEVLERMIAEYPRSRFVDEGQFRRAEYFFTRRKFRAAEDAYGAITAEGPGSEYYELALYKLGWTFYKQDLEEEALHQYVALLDYKVATGYDFEQKQDEDAERRIADTFRVISLCFSNLGGPPAVEQYFAANGQRGYEDRIYAQLGEYYFDKLRYQDAAAAYQAFVALHPLHRASPRFGMRVIEIYEAGAFPKLVLEAKKAFAATYRLDAEYWRHFDVKAEPEVLGYLKTNLEDLAHHYHAQFQDPELAADKAANFDEAARWYRAYLASFADDPKAPAIDHRLADLLLEHEDFAAAAREYERTAYEYPPHEQAAAAGYAAIYAHRQRQQRAQGAEQEAAKRDAVASTLRFVDAFPQHEHAAVVLGAAVDDLYEMKEFPQAIATGRRLLDAYPQADPSLRRTAWTVVAHASFELADYPQAEAAYQRVLEATPADDASRQGLVDNLAAAIYKQGEQANQAQDYRAASAHFLRVAQAAPGSAIRPTAEYDAAGALIRLEDWAGAAAVLDAFRKSHPEHPLVREATKQLALVYRKQGDLSRAGDEYERVAREADDPELGREALLSAGQLYEDAKATDRALAVYVDYVARFPKPIETAVETRSKLAEMYAAANDAARQREQLQAIVALDAGAGAERSDRMRRLAAEAALTLSKELYQRFEELALTQPFQASLREKRARLDAALEAFGRLVDYEVADVTAAATYYMAELYGSFGRAMLASERPADLGPAERADYENALEEAAFPFEGKSIEVHEKNLELLAEGIFDPWIEKSLDRLAELVPGRYAKPEASSGWLASLDTYAYQPPQPPAPVATTASEPAAAPPAAPAPAADDAVAAGNGGDADAR